MEIMLEKSNKLEIEVVVNRSEVCEISRQSCEKNLSIRSNIVKKKIKYQIDLITHLISIEEIEIVD